jgi:Mn2+/Fe2+ NRAMP family transporter
MIETLSEMYVPTFGDWTRIVFLIGAWAVLFKTLYVSSASNSRLAADFFGLAGIANRTQPGWREKWIRRFCIMLPLVGLGLYFLRRDPKAMVIIGGFMQGATLPLISAAAIYLRYRRTDKRLAPSLLSDVCLWLAFVSITAVAIYAIRQMFSPGSGP